MKFRIFNLTIIVFGLLFIGLAFADQVALNTATKSMPGLIAHWSLEGNTKTFLGMVMTEAR